MKRFRLIVSAVTLLTLVQAACGGGIPTTEVPLTEIPATLPPPTKVIPTEIVIPTDASTPTATTIDLAGPPMVVGSKFTYIDGSILVAVPGGEFTMGYGGFDNPEHKVTLSDFWIYRNEVTNRQYAACVAAGICSSPSLEDNKIYSDPYRANDPVVGISWDQAQAYCSWVNGRLPTEAEWEKTARGPDGNIFPWGNGGPACDLLNYDYCLGETSNVVKYPDGMSYYEALNMAGNVFEWVGDWYKANYYGEAPIEDPLGPEIGDRRSVRSSGFQSGADDSIAARRYSTKPVDHRPDLGFRCVVEDPTYFAPFCSSVVAYGLDANGDPISGSEVGENCPNISVTFGPYCGPNYSPITTLTIGANPPDTPLTTTVPASCSGGPELYTCVPPGGSVNVSADCEVPPVGDPSCPPGMTLEGEKCTGTGYSGQCLPGTTYDTVNQCCTSIGGTDATYDICPVGTYYADPPGVCVPYPASGFTTHSSSVKFDSCNRPGNYGCTLSQGSCTGNTPIFCASLCSCISRTQNCP